MQKYIVVNQPEKWNLSVNSISVISSEDYLTNPQYSKIKKARIFNLCEEYKYQSKGYYVSLLAEARGHLALPTVKNLVDLKTLKIVRLVSDEFDDIIQRSLKGIKSQEFILSVYFGQNVARKYKELSGLFYKHFQVPLLRVKFNYTTKWNIQSVKAISELEIPKEHIDLAKELAKEYFTKKRYDTPKIAKVDFDLAILVNPKDPAPPSNPKALKKFIEIAERMDIYAEIIGPKDLHRLDSFDALFIRQSTEVNNEAYAFSRKAQQDGIAIVGLPRCDSKVLQ